MLVLGVSLKFQSAYARCADPKLYSRSFSYFVACIVLTLVFLEQVEGGGVLCLICGICCISLQNPPPFFLLKKHVVFLSSWLLGRGRREITPQLQLLYQTCIKRVSNVHPYNLDTHFDTVCETYSRYTFDT